MTTLVADTSALVNLGVGADGELDPLQLCLTEYDVLVPTTVLAELREIASYDDDHGRAATEVLDRTARVTARTVDLDSGFPLDDGENATVTLANETGAALVLCDELNSLGLVHASLADSRLLTTPTLLSVFVRNGRMSADEARDVLDAIGSARSWDGNAYVRRARSLLDGE